MIFFPLSALSCSPNLNPLLYSAFDCLQIFLLRCISAVHFSTKVFPENCDFKSWRGIESNLSSLQVAPQICNFPNKGGKVR